uniref:Uncharacterized protein n=1 Tax=Octopus bimaculoides TaxID=37653 RepID=A0A0L8H624_OCTBM
MRRKISSLRCGYLHITGITYVVMPALTRFNMVNIYSSHSKVWGFLFYLFRWMEQNLYVLYICLLSKCKNILLDVIPEYL